MGSPGSSPRILATSPISRSTVFAGDSTTPLVSATPVNPGVLEASTAISTILSSSRFLVACGSRRWEPQNAHRYSHLLSTLMNAWNGACSSVRRSSTRSTKVSPRLSRLRPSFLSTSSNSPDSRDISFLALAPPKEKTTSCLPAPGPAVDLLGANGNLKSLGSLTAPPASSCAFLMAVSGLTFASIRHRLWCPGSLCL